jgi:hypothetical protein
MGRKSSSKENRPASGNAGTTSGSASPGRSSVWWLLVVAVIVAGGGAYAIWGTGGSAGSSDSSQATKSADNKGTAADASEVAKNEPYARAMAALGPHKQASYPPVPYQSFAPPRPYDTVNAAFQFAAEHPEVLSYIPCFCGCQQGGHKGNEDCFVKARDKNGDVTEFEPHGVECAVCIDVATRARQMYTSGASVTQIRAAVEKEFKATYPSMTPTPMPPVASH